MTNTNKLNPEPNPTTPVAKEVIKPEIRIQAIRKHDLLVLALPEVGRSEVVELYAVLQGVKSQELDVLLQTPGGNIDSAFFITKLLRQHAKKVNILIPTYAKSAGTLICLGAETLVMSELSELGPLDSQVAEKQEGDTGQYKSALEEFKALEQIQRHALESLDTTVRIFAMKSGLKMSEVMRLAIEFVSKTVGSMYNQLDPKTIGRFARALEVGESYGKRVLVEHRGFSEERANQIVNKLVYGYPSHGFVIDSDELKKIGIETEIMDEEVCAAARELIPAYEDYDRMIRFIRFEKSTDGL